MSDFYLGISFLGVAAGGYLCGRVHGLGRNFKHWQRGFDEARRIYNTRRPYHQKLPPTDAEKGNKSC